MKKRKSISTLTNLLWYKSTKKFFFIIKLSKKLIMVYGAFAIESFFFFLKCQESIYHQFILFISINYLCFTYNCSSTQHDKTTWLTVQTISTFKQMRLTVQTILTFKQMQQVQKSIMPRVGVTPNFAISKCSVNGHGLVQQPILRGAGNIITEPDYT